MNKIHMQSTTKLIVNCGYFVTIDSKVFGLLDNFDGLHDIAMHHFHHLPTWNHSYACKVCFFTFKISKNVFMFLRLVIGQWQSFKNENITINVRTFASFHQPNLQHTMFKKYFKHCQQIGAHSLHVGFLWTCNISP